MKKYYQNLWDYVERICLLETDSTTRRRQKVTLVMIAIFCCFTGLITITNNLINSRPIIEVLMPLTFTLIVGIALVIYLYTKRFTILLYSFLTMILCIPVFFQISIGGFSGQGSVPIILWSILAPFGSMMFQNTKKATWWFIAYLILVISLLMLDEYFTQFAEFPISFAESTITHSDLMVSYGLAIVVLSIIIFVTMRYFVNAFQREYNRAEKLVVDLTNTNKELERTLKELRETQSELIQSEKMASLGKLAAGIAHEINNPIGALKSTASTSKQCVSKMEQYFEKQEIFDKIKDKSNLKNFIRILIDNSQVFLEVSNRISKTVNNFINFARLDKAGFDKIDINKSIDNTLTLIQHDIKAHTIVKKQYTEIPKIACYPGELNQVFMHLLTNAAHAIKEEGKIIVRTYLKNEKVHVQFTDTGIGIPPDQITGLFDPGFMKDGSRVKARLGLFISYNIIKKHRGEIKVESEVDKGSTFTIILPIDLEKKAND